MYSDCFNRIFLCVDAIDSDSNLKCLLCHTYQATIGDGAGSDETAALNTCTMCGNKLSVTKTSDDDSSVANSSTYLQLQSSVDLSSLPADEYRVCQLWPEEQDEQLVLSQEQLVVSSSKQHADVALKCTLM